MTVLQDMTQAQDMVAELARLREENARLKAKGNGIKVSEKGAVSVYGIQRFPVTLYADGWVKLLSKAQDILAFIEANKASLSVKD